MWTRTRSLPISSAVSVGERSLLPCCRLICDAVLTSGVASLHSSPFADQPLAAGSPCEHIFCKECIMPWIKTKANCPICRCSLSHAKLQPVHRVIQGLLNDILVLCPFHIEGCKWTGKRELWGSHASTCPEGMDIWFLIMTKGTQGEDAQVVDPKKASSEEVADVGELMRAPAMLERRGRVDRRRGSRGSSIHSLEAYRPQEDSVAAPASLRPQINSAIISSGAESDNDLRGGRIHSSQPTTAEARDISTIDDDSPLSPTALHERLQALRVNLESQSFGSSSSLPGPSAATPPASAGLNRGKRFLTRLMRLHRRTRSEDSFPTAPPQPLLPVSNLVVDTSRARFTTPRVSYTNPPHIEYPSVSQRRSILLLADEDGSFSSAVSSQSPPSLTSGTSASTSSPGQRTTPDHNSSTNAVANQATTLRNSAIELYNAIERYNPAQSSNSGRLTVRNPSSPVAPARGMYPWEDWNPWNDVDGSGNANARSIIDSVTGRSRRIQRL